jgi:radial spoke head protein 4/6
MTTLEEAKAFLKKDGADGTNLYDHLSDVLLKILVERPENVQDSFEYVSTVVKQQRYMAQPNGLDSSSGGDSVAKKDSARVVIIDRVIDGAGLTSVSAWQDAKVERWANAALDILKVSTDCIRSSRSQNLTEQTRRQIKSEEEAAAERPMGVADLLDEANMFEWAGVGFSKSETFRLSVALQRLAMANGTTNLRFWGKILGIGMDYYVAEGELGSPVEPEDVNGEEGATGVNRFTYWAMKDDGSYEWTRLPNLKREQILAARHLRRFVRGDLEGKVRYLRPLVSLSITNSFVFLGGWPPAVPRNREALLKGPDRPHFRRDRDRTGRLFPSE